MMDDLEETVAWRVFTDRAPCFAGPDRSCDPLRELRFGDSVGGRHHTSADSDEDWLEVPFDGSVIWVPRMHLHRVHPANEVEANLQIGQEIVNRWWGLPLQYEPDDLQPLLDEWRGEPEKEYLLRRETSLALLEMLSAARSDCIEIRVVSAYRSGEYQKGLYTNACHKDGPSQRYSAPPGHSEHQLGTCVDLTDSLQEYNFTEEFGSTPEGVWLEENASRYGFRRSYHPHNIVQTGYISEPWHWRHIGT